MDRLFLILSILVSLLFVSPVRAEVGMMGYYFQDQDLSFKNSFQTQLNDLLKSQNAASPTQLDCQQISDEQFTSLGDSWISDRVNNQNLDQYMEQRMGGEDSSTVKNMFQLLGRRLIGCLNLTNPTPQTASNQTKGGLLPMMGWGSYGWEMPVSYFGWGQGLFILIWVVALVDLILLGIYLFKKIRH